MIKPGTKVEIFWIDTKTTSGWANPENNNGFYASSIGYLMSQDNLFVKIAGTIGVNESGVADVTAIPTPIVVRIVKLKS